MSPRGKKKVVSADKRSIEEEVKTDNTKEYCCPLMPTSHAQLTSGHQQ